MFTDNLYETVLREPVQQGCNELFTVSGFASSTFANRHINDLISLNSSIKVNLIIGMKINRNDDIALKKLIADYPTNFRAHYYEGRGEVHSKVYCWTKANEPKICFTGSANYSQEAFLGKQQNQMVSDAPDIAYRYFQDLLLVSDDVDKMPIKLPKRASLSHSAIAQDSQAGVATWLIKDRVIKISLLSAQGAMVPTRSGLNWGQRPDQNREPNQAYLALYGDAKNEGFLPDRARTFTMITDDNQAFDMAVQQDNRKAISTADNSELGRYFRKRLGLANGVLVTKQHLEAYGRTDYTIEKIDEETFMLDFSV